MTYAQIVLTVILLVALAAVIRRRLYPSDQADAALARDRQDDTFAW